MADPTFYCENCGRKVAEGLDTCPGCGQEFDLVLCPSCGFKGDSGLFEQRCPNCGYIGEKDISTEIKPDQKKQFSPWFYRVLIVILTFILLGLIRLYILL